MVWCRRGSTLRFANRAKNIKNKPRINEDPKDAMLREFQQEIARLKREVHGRRDTKVIRVTKVVRVIRLIRAACGRSVLLNV